MNKALKKISCVLFSVILFAVTVLPANAVALYTDGDYTYAEIDENYVSLYNYTGENTVLTINDESFGKYVYSVYDYAFDENTAISGVDFSNAKHLYEIGARAFSECSALSTRVVLPSMLRSIGFAAFQDSTELPSVTVGGAVREIPDQCFYGCTSLTEVALPNALSSIGKLSFANCPQLGKIYISNTVTSIDKSAFKNSNNVTICCYYKSYGYHYAKNNNIPYELLDGVKLGDVDGDGDITI
ncbi:MAG: leucine-rich repeat domain-containing protein, partial [Eubacteriales bacterium]|nr:leucine-rich repeat domain-containing protein [Eubacteriales bacterium]